MQFRYYSGGKQILELATEVAALVHEAKYHTERRVRRRAVAPHAEVVRLVAYGPHVIFAIGMALRSGGPEEFGRGKSCEREEESPGERGGVHPLRLTPRRREVRGHRLGGWEGRGGGEPARH